MGFKYYFNYVVTLVIFCLCSTANATTPSFVKPCRQSDGACITAVARAAAGIFTAGLVQYGVEPLEPLYVARITSKQAGLDIEFTRTDVTGLKDCQILDIRFMDASRIKIQVKCNLVLKGDYKLGGRLLVLPVYGNGKYNIKITGIMVTLTQHMTTVQGDDGKKHWQVAKFDHDYKVMDNAHFKFDNLFDGNRLLAETTTLFANQNWEAIFTEIAPPIVDVIVKRVNDSIASLYKAVPIEDLVLP